MGIARAIGAIGFLPLFVGAGAIMLPTVVGGGLALTRVEWRRFVRVICVVAAAGPVVFVATELVGSFGYSLRAAAGFLAMLALYGTIVTATRYTIAAQTDGWRNLVDYQLYNNFIKKPSRYSNETVLVFYACS